MQTGNRSGPFTPHRQMNCKACQEWLEEDNSADIAFARANVSRQRIERLRQTATAAAKKFVKRGLGKS